MQCQEFGGSQINPLAARHENDAVPLMFVEECEAFGHPGVESAGAVFCDFAHDVRAIFEPLQLAARRHRKHGDLTILALIPVLQRKTC